MNTYQMGITEIGKEETTFTIKANNKKEAMEKARNNEVVLSIPTAFCNFHNIFLLSFLCIHRLC